MQAVKRLVNVGFLKAGFVKKPVFLRVVDIVIYEP